MAAAEENRGTHVVDDELEKGVETNHVSDINSGGVEAEDETHGFTEKERRHIMRRIDRRLVVTVGAMYCVSLMDRTNMVSFPSLTFPPCSIQGEVEMADW